LNSQQAFKKQLFYKKYSEFIKKSQKNQPKGFIVPWGIWK